MRKETKTGIIIGIIITAATVIYFAQVDQADDNDLKLNDLFNEPADNTKPNDENIAPANPDKQPQISTVSATEPPEPETINKDIETADAISTTTTNEPDTETIAEPTEDIDLNQTENQDIVKTVSPETEIETELDPFSNLPDQYPQQMNEPRFHSVEKGDSLYSISTKYFGTGIYWEDIYKANKDIITNASSLRIGWKLRIPSPEEIENN